MPWAARGCEASHWGPDSRTAKFFGARPLKQSGHERQSFMVRKAGVFLFVLISAVSADTNKKPVFGSPEACSGWTAVTNCVLAAFDTADVVALHDRHRQKGDSDLRIALVRDPMFPKKVRDIVVEFGNSRYQAILDRYIAGEDVKVSQVEPVWRNTTQLGVWDSPLYAEFFAAVREVNLKLPRSARIKVFAADPPIDWSTIRDRDSYLKFEFQREETPAQIVTQLVSSKRKILLIYGSNHLYHTRGLTKILEARLPKKVISVGTMSGADALQQNLRAAAGQAARPVLISMEATEVGRLNANEYLTQFAKPARMAPSSMIRPGDAIKDVLTRPSQPPPARPSFTPDPSKEGFVFPSQAVLSDLVDAYVFYGRKPTDDPRIDPDPAIYTEGGYGAELDRRKHLMGQ